MQTDVFKSVLSSVVAVASFTGWVAHEAPAAVLVATPHSADAVPYGPRGGEAPTGVTAATAQYFTIGNNATTAYNGVLVFRLPALPSGEFVESANMELSFMNIGGSEAADLDLYGLETRASSTVLKSDWFIGGDNDPDASKIVDSFLTPTSTVGPYYSTEAVDGGALAAFLQAQYDGGAEAGDYVFFRLNIDSPTAERIYYIRSNDYTTASGRPRLTLTTAPIPEPASLMLLGAGGLMVLARGRRG